MPDTESFFATGVCGVAIHDDGTRALGLLESRSHGLSEAVHINAASRAYLSNFCEKRAIERARLAQKTRNFEQTLEHFSQ